REAKASTFSGRFGRKERVEHLFFHVRRHTGAVVADFDFDTIAKIFGRGREGRLVVATVCLRSAPSGGVEAIGNHIQESAPDVLRENVRPPADGSKDCLTLISKPCVSARAPCQARLRISPTRALISITRCSPDPSRECCNIFLTMASARLP